MRVVSGFEGWGLNVMLKRLCREANVMTILGPTDRRIFLEFLILIGILSSVDVIGAYRYPTTTVASHGNLKVNGVGIYQDADCSVAVQSLDRRTLEPDSAENITCPILAKA